MKDATFQLTSCFESVRIVKENVYDAFEIASKQALHQNTRILTESVKSSMIVLALNCNFLTIMEIIISPFFILRDIPFDRCHRLVFIVSNFVTLEKKPPHLKKTIELTTH